MFLSGKSWVPLDCSAQKSTKNMNFLFQKVANKIFLIFLKIFEHFSCKKIARIKKHDSTNYFAKKQLTKKIARIMDSRYAQTMSAIKEKRPVFDDLLGI